MPPPRDSSSAHQFETVRKVRRYEQVAEQIRRMISEGALKPGDLLPPERELVAKLGVGRSSIRDAVRTLAVMGSLEPRQGHGTVVRDLSADALVVPLSLVLTDLLRESRSRSLQVPGRPQRSFDGHRRILRALQRRDAKAAEAAVRRHLKEIEEVVMRQL